MKYHLNVASHCFCIELCDEFITKKWLTQYQPFLVHDVEQPLFSCQITSKAFQQLSSWIPLYVEKSPEGYMRFELYSTDNSQYIIKTAVNKTDEHIFFLCMTTDYRQSTLYLNAPTNMDEEFLRKVDFICENTLRFLYAQNTATLQTICLHASAVCHANNAYLFMGHSGSGKSTHSQLWLEHIEDTELMNDDNPVIRLKSDGHPIVYGSPWSGKTPCYKNKAFPLGGMAHIIQAKENTICGYKPIDGYRFLRASAAGFPYVDKIVSNGIFETIERIVRQFTVYQLACKPDKEAAMLCKDTLTK